MPLNAHATRIEAVAFECNWLLRSDVVSKYTSPMPPAPRLAAVAVPACCWNERACRCSRVSDRAGGGGRGSGAGVWIPVNCLIIRALLQYYTYYGNDFTVECPTGSGRQKNLYQVAEEISRRLVNIFLRGKDGRRPVYGSTRKFQEDPHWRDLVLFYEYFHGDNGAGLGASHQTGWTGCVARLMHLFATMTPEIVLEEGKKAVFEATARTGRAKPTGGVDSRWK